MLASPPPLGVLTLADLALLLDVPGVQGRPLLVLHGRALVEVLRQVGLVETRGLHHLPLRQVVLLHVALHHLRHVPGVPSVTQTASDRSRAPPPNARHHAAHERLRGKRRAAC